MEIEAQLESIDKKIDKYSKKTDKLSTMVKDLNNVLKETSQNDIKTEILNLLDEKLNSQESTDNTENIKKFLSQIKKDYNKNQKGLNTQIEELKTAINTTNEVLSQNTLENETETIKNLFNDIETGISNIKTSVNVDIDKIDNLITDFKTNSDLSNNAIKENITKIENLLVEYKENIAEIKKFPTLPQNDIKAILKDLNDEFYIEMLKLFNSLSFEDEAEDLKDFIENIISVITQKADENSEKLNSIMLQCKNLMNKIEAIENAQKNLNDYLKPEDADDIAYSFDDIQSDLAKMRLVLNDISNTVSSTEIVEEISDKIEKTSLQIENVSKMLNSTTETDENVSDIRNKIETLNSQVYDISMRTNKLLLTNEDSTLELRNNLEEFKEVFDRANPEKLYELFYELTHYFNDTNEKIIDVSQTTLATHNEAITIKNALTYVAEWLDSATITLNELKANSEEFKSNNKINNVVAPAQGNSELSNIVNSINEIKGYNNYFENISAVLNELRVNSNAITNKISSDNSNTIVMEELNKINNINQKQIETLNNGLINFAKYTQEQFSILNKKLDILIDLNQKTVEEKPEKKPARTRRTTKNKELAE